MSWSTCTFNVDLKMKVVINTPHVYCELQVHLSYVYNVHSFIQNAFVPCTGIHDAVYSGSRHSIDRKMSYLE